jgi:hypothetical protein
MTGRVIASESAEASFESLSLLFSLSPLTSYRKQRSNNVKDLKLTINHWYMELTRGHRPIYQCVDYESSIYLKAGYERARAGYHIGVC